MLTELFIQNVALIDSATIKFDKGLNVLSGETGAGKSVILESLNFVLGAKADKSLIRNGQEECFVKAEFELDYNKAVEAIFDELDIEKDNVLIISRRFSINGRNSIKVNGNTVTVSMLKKFTSVLLDVHGQSEHFYLLSESNQLALLDKIGGAPVLNIKSELKDKFSSYKKIISELSELGGDEQKRQIRLDVLNYQIKEITDADIKDGEEEELVSARQKLAHQEKILASLSMIKNSLCSEGGVSDILSNATREAGQISDLGQDYSDIYDRLSSALSDIDDISSTVSDLSDSLDGLDFDPDYVEERLDKIKKIKKKYGSSVEEINAFYDSAVAERDKLIRFDELSAELLKDKESAEKELYKLYTDLHKERVDTAKDFAEKVKTELFELGITRANFTVDFSDFPKSVPECSFTSDNGADSVRFMFSANLGEPLKPLSSVISGGEMSRFMLAVKSLTAKYNDIGTFVFDEIDAGISGKIAKIVAEKFAKIAKNVQIIAISHLPQISAMADNNLLIEKTENGDKTVTNVYKLDNEQKLNEIIRLVGGSTDSQSAKNHAKDLIKQADEYKKTV